MLTDPTTGAALEEAACAHFLPCLTFTEDFDSFEVKVNRLQSDEKAVR